MADDKPKVRVTDWIANCDEPSRLREGMRNAKSRQRMDVYWLAFRRLCELEGMGHDTPLEREFYVTLAAYEELLTEKNGRTTKASRTRQKLQRKGAVQCLEEWAVASAETEGFRLLVDAGMPELTGEHLVLKYPDQFTAKALEMARGRLEKAGGVQ